MIKRRNLSLAIISAVVLGVLIYVPVIPHSPPAYSIPALCYYGACSISVISPYLNSITLQFFNFGAQYSVYSGFLRGSYAFCPIQGCGVWYEGIFYGILVSTIALSVVFIISFIFNRRGERAASAQIGFGASAIFWPLLQFNSAFISEELVVAGTVLILTGVAELWWFRIVNEYAQRGELPTVEQFVDNR